MSMIFILSFSLEVTIFQPKGIAHLESKIIWLNNLNKLRVLQIGSFHISFWILDFSF